MRKKGDREGLAQTVPTTQREPSYPLISVTTLGILVTFMSAYLIERDTQYTQGTVGVLNLATEYKRAAKG